MRLRTEVATTTEPTLTDEDLSILRTLRPIVRGFAGFLGPNCEVVLHSMHNLAESVMFIENGHVTGRSVGSPVTDLALRILHSTEEELTRGEDPDYRVYTSHTADGRPLRCVTTIIRNKSKSIGMLCINFDLSVPLHEILKFLSNVTPSGLDPEKDDAPEHYMISAEDLVTRTLGIAIQKSSLIRGISPQARNRAIVQELNWQGIFDVKGAIDLVSSELGVSRFTVYNYLRDLRNEGEENETEG